MPEGDTLHKIAQVLDARGRNRLVTRALLLQRAEPQLVRRRLLRVEVHGKHIIFVLSPEGPLGLWLRVHLGMVGQWHTYRKGAAFKRPYRRANVLVELEHDWQLVCFDAQDVALSRPAAPPAHAPQTAALTLPIAAARVRHLGPQLITTDAFDAVLRAVQRLPAHALILDVLLNQRIAAGLGNVYKSELLFLLRVHPLACAAQVPMATIESLFRLGQRWLRANLGGWPRTLTVDRRHEALPKGMPRLHVYNRAQKPCLVCEAPVHTARLGRHGRTTFWCPQCQPPQAVGLTDACPLTRVNTAQWAFRARAGAMPARQGG